MTDEQQPTKKTPWRLHAVRILILVLVVGIAGQWWLERPERSALHFINLLSKGQFNEAAEMLRDVSTLQTDSNGDITVTASDGTTARLTADESRLVALIIPGTQSRNGIGDYLFGRYNFHVATLHHDVQSGWRQRVKIRCAAQGSKIVIEAIE